MKALISAIGRAKWGRLAVAGAVAVVLSASARAETPAAGTSSGVSPVEEFSQQLEAFQKSVPDLNKSIQDSAGTIDSVTDVEKARAEIDRLRETVAALLGAVSDNGPVSQLGVKALDHIHAKLKTLEQETRYKPEERQFLIEQWRKLELQTESASKELDDARVQFAGLLQTLQQNEDFIGELIEIRQAEKALEVIRHLTRDIRDASTQLNKLIGGVGRGAAGHRACGERRRGRRRDRGLPSGRRRRLCRDQDRAGRAGDADRALHRGHPARADQEGQHDPARTSRHPEAPGRRRRRHAGAALRHRRAEEPHHHGDGLGAGSPAALPVPVRRRRRGAGVRELRTLPTRTLRGAAASFLHSASLPNLGKKTLSI